MGQLLVFRDGYLASPDHLLDTRHTSTTDASRGRREPMVSEACHFRGFPYLDAYLSPILESNKSSSR